MRKKHSILKVLGVLGFLLLFLPKVNVSAAPLYAGTDNTNVWYKAHVQKQGWQETVVNGDVAGTTGQALRLEALQIDVSDSASFWIEYNAYVDTLGWVGVQKDGQTIGTTGRALPMNGICIAIKDKNTKQDSTTYDVYYRVHVRDIGWESWTKNGNLAGDTYGAKPIEAIEIQIRPKGQSPVISGQSKGEQIVAEAKKYIGVPYVWDGESPAGFDCSGFTTYVYRQFGINIPSYTVSQVQYGSYVAYSNLQPGDLVFFNNTYNGANPTHVGIYAGNGQMVHAGDNGVEVSYITTSYWQQHYSTARRLL